MPKTRTCPDCGTPLPSGVREDHCPACAFEGALALGPGIRVRYFGDYELLEKIGEGGFGEVYRARQLSLKRLVALKMIRSGQFASETEVERFHIEAEAAARLDHPNIVGIFEVGQHQGQHYFSMKLVEGESLEARVLRAAERPRLKREVARANREAARLVATVARAVHYAHQCRVLHRDLKPGNILVDAQGEPYVTDFGLARCIETDGTSTRADEVVGTPSFMAPEQAAGKTNEVTTAADIYGLGAVLYFLLARRAPFAAETRMATLRCVKEQQAVRPSAINPQVDADLEAICLKCLEKEPQRRYGSAEALAEDLERWLRQEPILARPVASWERAVKWAKRKPAVAALLVALVAVAAVGFLGVIWQWHQAVTARGVAQQRAIAEARARTEADSQRDRAEQALTRMQLERVEQLFDTRNACTAVATLVALLRHQPTNRAAAHRLISALTYRAFALPSSDMKAAIRPLSVVLQQSPDPSGRLSRLLDATSAQPLTKQLKHDGHVNSAEFSPDGRRVVTASGDRTARVWDGRTGQPLTEPLEHDGSVHFAHFSPDGQRVVTSSGDEIGLVYARVWDALTGQPVTQPLRYDDAHSPVASAQFSPDGQRLVTASGRSAVVWDAHTGQLLTKLLEPFRVVNSAEFSPDGRRVVTASEDQTARVWDGRTGQPLTEPLEHDGSVHFTHFSPDGQRVVTISGLTVRVWDARTGQPLTKPLEHDSDVLSAQFSPDSQEILTASRYGNTQVWNVRTGQPLTAPLKHDLVVDSCHFASDGQRVVTIFDGGTARVWDVRTGQPLTEWLTPDVEYWTNRLTAGEQHLAAEKNASAERDAARVSERDPWRQQWRRSDFDTATAKFSPDGQRLVTTHSDTAWVWPVWVPPVPMESWVLDLAESVLGFRCNEDQAREEFVLPESSLRQRILERTNTDFYTSWAQWFLRRDGNPADAMEVH